MLDLVPNDDLCSAETFADFLKARLRRLTLTPEALARDVGVSVSEARSWLADALPPANRLWCVAEVLNVEPADLLWALALAPVVAPAKPTEKTKLEIAQPVPLAAKLPPLPRLEVLPNSSESSAKKNGRAAVADLLGDPADDADEDSEDEESNDEPEEEEEDAG